MTTEEYNGGYSHGNASASALPMPPEAIRGNAKTVFISYSTKNPFDASLVCGALENAGIRCWVAPRDLLAGTNFANNIEIALGNAKMMVLVLSHHSAKSPWVEGEINTAFSARKPILVFRIDDIDLEGSLKLMLGRAPAIQKSGISRNDRAAIVENTFKILNGEPTDLQPLKLVPKTKPENYDEFVEQPAPLPPPKVDVPAEKKDDSLIWKIGVYLCGLVFLCVVAASLTILLLPRERTMDDGEETREISVPASAEKSVPAKENSVPAVFPEVVEIPGIDYLKMGKFEVTQEQFFAVMKQNPSKCSGKNLPADSVTWNEANAYCEKLTELARNQGIIAENQRYRLPTQKEWYHAARAGTYSRYVGNVNTHQEAANFGWDKRNSGGVTKPVGSKPPNAFGLYDMAGNVWEWCEAPKNAQQVQARGLGIAGFFNEHAIFFMHSNHKDFRCNDFGLRVVLVDCEKERAAAEKEIVPEVAEIPGADFKMGKFEITRYQWNMICGNADETCFGDDFPIGNINWNAATDFCEKLTQYARERNLISANEVFRLPTNEEFLQACKHNPDDQSRHGWNRKILWPSPHLLHPGGEVYVDTAGTILIGPNAYGIWNMHGNLWEWTYEKLVRGGSYVGEDVDCDYCREWPANKCWADLGFRVALVPAEKAVPAAKILETPKSVPAVRTDDFDKTCLADVPAGTLANGTRVEAFKIGKTEVTQAQWQKIMGRNPAHFRGNGDLPVESISWVDMMAFCEKLTARERKKGNLKANEKFTLPTKAQWQIACRAGTTTKFYSGNSELDFAGAAWYFKNSGDRPLAEWSKAGYEANNCRPHPVAQKVPNPLGIFDLYGNVWEMTLEKVGLGGCCAIDIETCGSADGVAVSDAMYRDKFLGFRVALVKADPAADSQKIEKKATEDFAQQAKFSGKGGNVEVKLQGAGTSFFEIAGQNIALNADGNVEFSGARVGTSFAKVRILKESASPQSVTISAKVKMKKRDERRVTNDNALGIFLGNGYDVGVLMVREDGVYWSKTYLNHARIFSGDMTKNFHDVRVAYFAGTSGAGTGFYVWVDDELVAEALAAANDTARGEHRCNFLFGDTSSEYQTFAEVAGASVEVGKACAPAGTQNDDGNDDENGVPAGELQKFDDGSVLDESYSEDDEDEDSDEKKENPFPNVVHVKYELANGISLKCSQVFENQKWLATVGKMEVSQQQWGTLMKKNLSYEKADSYPVTNVSWDDAIDFCWRLTRFLREKHNLPKNLKVTLPTSKQWEFLCRAGAKNTRYYDEKATLEDCAWYRKNSAGRISVGGAQSPNKFALFDMLGNASEWCLDTPVGKPNNRVLRGGNFNSTAQQCEVSVVTNVPATTRNKFIGFRVVIVKDDHKKANKK